MWREDTDVSEPWRPGAQSWFTRSGLGHLLQQPAASTASTQSTFAAALQAASSGRDAVCRQGLWLLLRAGFLSTRELRWPPSFSTNSSPAFQTEKLKFPDQKNPWSRPGNEGSACVGKPPRPCSSAGSRVAGLHTGGQLVLSAHSRAEPASRVGEQCDGEDPATLVSERGLKSVE